MAHSSEGERYSFLTTLFLGPKGIFANAKIKNSLLEDIFCYVMGKKESEKASLNADFLFTMLKKIFEVSPQTKQMTLAFGLFDELLKNRNQIEEELSATEKENRKNQSINKFLVSFGTVGIKLGQILSKQTELIKDEGLRTLLEDLSDKVPAIDKRFVLAALKRDAIDTSKIKSIGRLLGSASLKQVYLVTMSDNKEHVLKFNRPMSYYEIPENMTILKDVFASDEVTSKLPLSKELLKAIDESVNRELSIKSEMDQQKEIASFIKKNTNSINSWSLTIPEINDKLVGTHLYLDQFAKGEPLKKELLSRLAEKDKKNISKLIYTSLMEQIFINGKYHADLHGGNILVDPASKTVNLIDFGNCATIGKANKDLFIDLILSIKSSNQSKISSTITAMLASASDLQKFNQQKIQTELTAIIIDKKGENAKISQKIRSIKNFLDKNAISFNSELELLLKVFDTTDYISKNLTAEEIQAIFVDAIGFLTIMKKYF
ncbi:MAG: AarF/ABC1/UbiB kinase family protein [Oligoflexia bacterium]|nr:AarF/ABC1/UbiB kinase family protein [Oligoflexia bacterium]